MAFLRTRRPYPCKEVSEVNSNVGSLQTNPLCKLSGKISSYKCQRAQANFVFSTGDQKKLGVVAIAAALADMGGQAASVAASASAMEEEADFVEFDLNGDKVKGWVWRSPFKEGDIVDVVAQWQGFHYELYGIARPVDKTIALYPHCSRSRTRHIKNAIKWWFIFNAAFLALLMVTGWFIGMEDMLQDVEFYYMYGPVTLFFVLMFSSLTKQFMPFVQLSERVFVTLDLPNPTNIDLVESSNKQRTADDPGEFGTFYFRY